MAETTLNKNLQKQKPPENLKLHFHIIYGSKRKIRTEIRKYAELSTNEYNTSKLVRCSYSLNCKCRQSSLLSKQSEQQMNETENKQTVEKINKAKNWFFEKINKIDNPLTILIRKKENHKLFQNF